MIVKATKQDAEKILEIQKQAYKREAITYNNNQIAPLIETVEQVRKDLETKVIFKAVRNDEIIGSVRGFVENETCYVERLMVSPSHQGKGIGKKLMGSLENYFSHCKRFDLYTGSKSVYNIRFYQSLGYKQYKTEMIRENINFVFLEKINEDSVEAKK
ncbi:GNAT family N-acetyltransferase [Bacillus shivajii]|uniref:GNAT family N-acetyltransferase n=1 Tax=Bacillus shivajii TaxID=1983719 RepID=UPI001CFA9CFB|nr:GNAT family N-acetyltransferase [Bacillus shivajii]UCZ52756.1 GNAT family N-acetyltransferase [Bacillus shivajii]